MINRAWIGLVAVVVLAAIAVLAVLPGCTDNLGKNSGGKNSGGPSAMAPDQAQPAYRCPLLLPGATVTSTDVVGGAALAFDAGNGDLAELRRRVLGLAELHSRYHAGGGMLVEPGPRAAGGGEGPGRKTTGRGLMKPGSGMRMPAATAAVQDIQGGARLAFWPRDPTQLESLRAYVQRRARRMAATGDCPMIAARVEQSPPSQPVPGTR